MKGMVIIMNIKNWVVAKFNKEIAVDIMENLSIDPLLAILLQVRGAYDPESALGLIENDVPLDDPFIFADMDIAVDRIIYALENNEKIAVYGDYDADGVTSTAILYTYLKEKGADVMYYIPNRHTEGYGMKETAVEKLAEIGVNLIVTVDNGSSCFSEVKRATDLGVDVIITDHHQIGGELPPALGVVNPHRNDCPSEFKMFCGAGIALKLITAIETDLGDPDTIIEKYADLAAIGTIGDVMPLLDENRTIVKAGLEALKNSNRIGINALMEVAVSPDREFTATTVAFSLVPRINAVGRMSSAEKALKLLISEDVQEANELADELCRENSQRQAMEKDIAQEAIDIIENDEKIKYSRVIVVASKNWHEGIIGIVASRITERYGKPTFVISINGKDSKGSGRSFKGFDIFSAMTHCKDELVGFGGHYLAGGISLDTDKIDAFRDKINEYARINHNLMPSKEVNLDRRLQLKELKTEMLDTFSCLEPFGQENPVPLFGLYGVTLDKILSLKDGTHVKLFVSKDGVSQPCMKFFTSPEEIYYKVGDVLDLAVTLSENTFRGETSLSVKIVEIKAGGLQTDRVINEYRIYEKYKAKETLTATEAQFLLPTRNDLAEIYKYIRSKGNFQGSLLKLATEFENINFARILVALDILEERQLINMNQKEESVELSLIKADRKVDIFASEIFKEIKALEK